MLNFSVKIAFALLLIALAFPNATIAAASSLPKYIDEYVIPTEASAPLAITTDSNGIIWFTESNTSKLGRFDPRTTTFKEYVVPGIGDMWGITVDQDGYVWLTQYSGKGSTNPGGAVVGGGQGRLVRFSPLTSNFNIVDIPTTGSFPFRIVADGQGRVWFTELLGNKIGVYDPSSRRLEEYDVPSSFAGPADLTFDSHGNLWFTEAYNQSLARFQTSTKSFVEYHLATTDPSRFVASPVGIAVASNGEVWFADHGGSWIVDFNPVSRASTRYPAGAVVGAAYGIAIPNGLLIDGQGKVWFCEHWGNRVSYFDPVSQTMVEFAIPTGPISTTLWITLAPNGEIWFTEWATNKIGVVHPNLPVPFTVDVPSDRSQLTPGQETTLFVSTKVTAQVGGNGTLRYSWSSYVPNEVQVTFSPQAYPTFATLAETSTQARVRLSERVRPGNYTISIGIDTGVVLVSRMHRVEVTQARPSFALPRADLLLLIVGVFASILGGFFLRKKLALPAKQR